MTSAARRDVASIYFRARRMTGEAGNVSIQSRGYRECDAAAASSMTSRTSRACRRMFGVIESDVKASQPWKRFDFSALRIGMATHTDLSRRICKLLCVTTRARRVCGFARQRGLRRIVLSPVTKQTRQPRVIAIIVLELGIVCLGQSSLITAEEHDAGDDHMSDFHACQHHFAGFGIALR